MSSNHYLSRMFGSTPVPSIERHMSVVTESAVELRVFFEAVCRGDDEQLRNSYSKISELESSADDMKRQIRLHLPKTMFMPVARADLLAMVSVQDHVANIAQDLAGQFTTRPVKIPGTVADPLKALVSKAVETTEQANVSVGELTELFQSGFRGAEVKLVETMLARLDALEHEADALETDVRAAIYSSEAELPPLDAYFLYRTVDLIGELGDEAQRVGAHLLLLLAR